MITSSIYRKIILDIIYHCWVLVWLFTEVSVSIYSSKWLHQEITIRAPWNDATSLTMYVMCM